MIYWYIILYSNIYTHTLIYIRYLHTVFALMGVNLHRYNSVCELVRMCYFCTNGLSRYFTFIGNLIWV